MADSRSCRCAVVGCVMVQFVNFEIAADDCSVEPMLAKIDRARFRSREHARLRPGLSLGKDTARICRHDWRRARLRRAAATSVCFSAGQRREAIGTLFRARSSARGNLRVRFRDDPAMHEARDFLPRAAHHSAAALGMSCHVHLFVDETGGAHPADFARAAHAFRRRGR